MLGFVQRHVEKVTGVLHGFDRLRFRGTLRQLAYGGGMMEFLWQAKVLLKDFGTYVTGVTKQIKAAVEQTAEQAGRPTKYLTCSSTNKEAVARQIAAADRVEEGLICVLSCVENCKSFEVRGNKQSKQLELRSALRKCLHYYFYFQHPRLGFLHARLQSWFPFDLRVCLNGREWLCRELDRAGIGYARRENCLIAVADVSRAQELLDEQLRTDWTKQLDEFAALVHPLRTQILRALPVDYYWSLDESEWASDVMFRSPRDLAQLYPGWVRHAMSCFGSRDVMRFLGRKVPTTGVHGAFQGEVISDLKQRPEGMRVKHRVKNNSIKMYDKQGSVLRVETTINDPSDFQVFRPKEGDPEGPKSWQPLRKGAADMHRRAEVSQAANERYLDGLAAVEQTKPLAELTAPLCKPTRYRGRSVRALNPLAAADAKLLEAINRGEFTVNGFRNRDLQPWLYSSEARTLKERRRRSAQTSRQLRMLRAHGLIRKVPKSHRYQLTDFGRVAVAALLTARQADTAKLAAAA
jgi:hypothetical protein